MDSEVKRENERYPAMNAQNMAPCRGVVRGGTVVLTSGAAGFPEESEVLVVPVASRPGTSEAVLAAVAAAPHVTRDDVDALEHAIVVGRRGSVPLDPFAEAAQ